MILVLLLFLFAKSKTCDEPTWESLSSKMNTDASRIAVSK